MASLVRGETEKHVQSSLRQAVVMNRRYNECPNPERRHHTTSAAKSGYDSRMK